jgi:hypothetical protein
MGTWPDMTKLPDDDGSVYVFVLSEEVIESASTLLVELAIAPNENRASKIINSLFTRFTFKINV